MKKILIDRCVDCSPYFENYNHPPTCFKSEGNEIEDIETIPLWCPLPDDKTDKLKRLLECLLNKFSELARLNNEKAEERLDECSQGDK